MGAAVAALLLVGEDGATLRDVASDLVRDGYAVATVDPLRALNAQLPSNVMLAVIDQVECPTEKVDVFCHLSADCDVPVAIVDHGESLTERALWLALGARDVLTRTDSARQLSDEIRALVRRPTISRSAELLTLGPLSLNVRTRFVRGPLGRRRLTNQEALLLEFLMTHPGKVYDRTALLEEVWGHSVGNASTVTVHIRRLREKIEHDPSNPDLLVTVWSSGYCLVAGEQ